MFLGPVNSYFRKGMRSKQFTCDITFRNERAIFLLLLLLLLFSGESRLPRSHTFKLRAEVCETRHPSLHAHPKSLPPQLHRGNQEYNASPPTLTCRFLSSPGPYKEPTCDATAAGIWGYIGPRLCSRVCGSASQIDPEQNPLRIPAEQSTNSPSRRGQPQHGQQAWHTPEPPYVEPRSLRSESSHFPIKASNCLQSSQQFWS